MNNRISKLFRQLSIGLALVAVLCASSGAWAQAKKNSHGEAFYIIASVDRARSQILLKLPTEITTLIKVDDKTQYLDEAGKPIKLADLQTGNTVWVAAGGGDAPTASRIRKGPMTVVDLHQLYLDYPAIK